MAKCGRWVRRWFSWRPILHEWPELRPRPMNSSLRDPKEKSWRRRRRKAAKRRSVIYGHLTIMYLHNWQSLFLHSHFPGVGWFWRPFCRNNPPFRSNSATSASRFWPKRSKWPWPRLQQLPSDQAKYNLMNHNNWPKDLLENPPRFHPSRWGRLPSSEWSDFHRGNLFRSGGERWKSPPKMIRPASSKPY